MDSSTITFIATLVIAFIFLRWFISSDEEDEATIQSTATSTSPSQSQAQDSQHDAEEQSTRQERLRRPVTNSMIEVVQQLAPHLTVGQIKLDLQRTGSVQETVDRFLSEGTLPYPEGEGPNASRTANPAQDSRNQVDNIKPENLLKKYGINESKSEESTAAASGSSTKEKGWSESAEDRASTLQQKKVDMIVKARKRLESQLKNEQDLSKLAE
ncbi:hypothetical protein WICANDRAFT_29271 [Wickerhamomyces anomalus NRRL Y-366-8]|uniref:Coupling of ubiquitin conjugation to ER degradation protein 1 n=1 Tax=Wickerhamomyces anomalus (strain ATCC 58044 / CBS 1984 / NCYC 433 / NRRL Y-366-8) TaxID=683960 RepID=A0A1E3P730_WICAA|nr:uncharacterized protein WICANDRAFT_29271 [Wickerhamomyces anomalus NRRL Y-366-8]ODQ61158.1 hypothetical protein WICANDRAFT_29271 [Wickerhamomyces anomalus NRRL Y-366-8]